MSLKDEVLEISNNKRTLEQIMDSLDQTEQEELEELLVDKKITATAIARVLRKRNFDIHERTIQRERNRRLEELTNG